MRLPALLASALASFVTANLIHNSGGLDPAIVPATVLAAAVWRRPGPALSRAAAVAIALPALYFFKWASLTDPVSARVFLNHLALLLAGLLAIASIALGPVPTPRPRT
jgi:hypothetical protein